MKKVSFVACVVAAFTVFGCVVLDWMRAPIGVSAAPGQGESDLAQQILEAAGVKGGLIVHLGCGDGSLTAALGRGGSYVVHGLDANAKNIEAARQHIQSLGLYGRVSVEQWTGSRLPYADNLVNLVVTSGKRQVASDELMRVLAPGGVAVSVNPKSKIQNRKSVKPRPKETDEWTHYLHDATGNAVAHDQVVGPPRLLQWAGEPRYTRSHEHTPSVAAVVSSNGRIFYIVDEAPISSILRPAQWHLVARDAYNGVVLWDRPLEAWWPHICGWTAGPPQLQRRLVAVADRVYVALGLHAPLSVLDAATGKTLKVYDQTEGVEEILWHNGVLLLAVRSVTDERTAELGKWAQLSREKKSPLYTRDTMAPLLKGLRSIESKADLTVLALDADSGRVLWKKAGEEVAGLPPLTLCVSGGRAFYQKGADIACLDLKSGKEQWSASSTARLRFVSDRCVVCADGKTVTALSPDTGKVLWSQQPPLSEVRDAFLINGSIYLGGFKPLRGKDVGKRGPAWGPYYVAQHDLATGKLLGQIEPENPSHHHRCYSNKATDRYIVGGRRGTEFIDLQTGEVLWHSWARGVCMYGVMPCNGLLYVPPHACGCYASVKLSGFNALAPASKTAPTPLPDDARLERGPAYSQIRNSKFEIRDFEEWPTYRHDGQRSGFTLSAVPPALRSKWTVAIGGKLTAPTVAGSKVFVASPDEHKVYAIDADSGRLLWNFTAGARVDSPPTLYGDEVLFGCRDGYVYSVRASDGVLAWRVRVAREERRIVARDRIESASPAHGSVLVQDGTVYVTAGRSSYLDSGIDLCRLQPATGNILSRTAIYSPDPETGKQPQQYGPAAMPGARSDILASDDQYIYLRDLVYGKDGSTQPEGNPHLFTVTDFLDDTWPHRSYWIFGTKCSLATGCSSRDKDLVYGRLLVFDDSKVYGYGRKGVHWSNQLEDGPYRLFAVKRGESAEQWARPVQITVRAMILAGKVLFVAGPRVDTGEGPTGRKGALLLAISATDGADIAQYSLDCAPVFDGMATVNGQLYLSTLDGRVICFGAKQ